ncbi:MAG: ATP-dependent zinc metalloprotease FtsH [Verrucomicrobia bacterium]|nr:ATP-dependent zinc metalloprotease FtsH [Verrucomicrobiota bacterium]
MLTAAIFLVGQNADKPTVIPYTSPDNLNFVQLVEEGKVGKCKIIQDMAGPLYVTGELKEGMTEEEIPGEFKAFLASVDSATLSWLRQNGVETDIPPQNPILWHIASSILPIIIIFGLLYFLFIRQVRNAGSGAMSFGKSRARLLNQDRNKVTFKNVAGINEAEEEVQEIIEFLKDPKKFQKLGGRIPKGVMLMGPPGTGKTLLAKAIAGEADVPFFSISGSDFVEMFVGVGASRVRDMFEQGKKNAPCIIFIDEIDAVGRSRFTGIGGGHDEREQTLNALLVEMDGFETQQGVIILAATNRPDVLDPALLRRGRFDRQIVIDLPMIDGREEILKIHSRSIKLAESADLRRTARGTPGFSGADLENLLNEAALLAARDSKEAVEMKDLEEARDKVMWGSERRSRAMDDKEKKLTAYHEAGHALVQQLTKGTEPVHKVTIIPRGVSYLGATMSLPEKDSYTQSREKLLGEIAVCMGGRVAEELIFGDITNGASSDLKHATEVARLMVCNWGMSEELGPQQFGNNQELMFLGREVSREQNYSEETARRIDVEVARLLREAHTQALESVTTHRDKLEMIAERLLEHETIDGRDIEEIVTEDRVLSADERDVIDKQKEAEEAAKNPPVEPPPIPEAVPEVEEPKAEDETEGAEGGEQKTEA